MTKCLTCVENKNGLLFPSSVVFLSAEMNSYHNSPFLNKIQLSAVNQTSEYYKNFWR